MNGNSIHSEKGKKGKKKNRKMTNKKDKTSSQIVNTQAKLSD